MLQDGLLNTEEYNQIIHQWNAREKEYPKHQTIDCLFQEQVKKRPQATALIDGEREISFHALNQLKNRIANYLLLNKCQKHQTIAVKLDNTSYLVATLLAIKSIKCIYVPLDVATPMSRVDYIMQNSGAAFLFDDDLLTNKLAEILLQSDQFLPIKELENHTDSVECIIYTSGSTGNPKGVKITHSGIMNRLHWMWNTYPFQADEVCCIKTSIGFVDHIWEIFGPLLSGIPAVMIKKKEVLNIREVINALAIHSVTRIVLVPSLLDEILNYDPLDLSRLEKLNLWSCSGEELKYPLVSKFYETFQSSTKRLLNIYGSTEVTADATYFDTYEDYNLYKTSPQPSHKSSSGLTNTFPSPSGRTEIKLPIGIPIDNVKTYILDEHLKPVPYNSLGEICVSGACLSSGYINYSAPQSPFIEHPFIPGEKLYKTGDYGKLTPNGQIIYWGRKDSQVKINGCRIELGEIEYALSQIEGVKQACVLAKEIKLETGTHPYLVGYYILNDNSTLNQDAIQHNLLQILPEYMVPKLFVRLESFPLNINGKLDKLAFPSPDFNSFNQAYVEPTNEIEKQICAIWQKILGSDRVGITDDFFRIGGTSILAIQVSHQMSMVSGHEIPVADIFRYKNISEILHHHQIQTQTSIPRTNALQTELSFSQQRLWFIEQYEQGTHVYHIPEIYELDATTDLAGIKYAIQQIISRHEILRSTIEQANNQAHGTQKVHHEPLLMEQAIVADEVDLQSLLREDMVRPFDLSTEYPIRVKFYTIQSKETGIKNAQNRTIMFINFHHIASDGWSITIFQRELLAYYQAYVHGENNFSLPALDIQYKDYAIWQKTYLSETAILGNQLNYWMQYLSEYQTLEVSTDYPRPHKIDYRGSSQSFELSKETSDQLRALAKAHGTTMHNVLLSSIYILLSKYTGQEDIVVGGVIANRHIPKTEDIIGLFVNTQVNRAVLNKNQSYDELIKQVHQDQIQAQLHQDLPFEKLVSALGVPRDASRHPIFQVMFMVNDLDHLNKVYSDQQEPYLKPFQIANLYEIEKFDLSITIDNSYPEINGQISYAINLFHKDTIERLIGHYIQLLARLLEAPEQPYSRHSLLNTQQYDQIINQWNTTEKYYPKHKTVNQLFQEQARRIPDSPALVFEKQKLTYQELDEKSNQLAWHIRKQYQKQTKKALQPDTLIALYLDRGLEMVIGILAVMKAGGAYVPIDINYPQERIDYMLSDTGATFILTTDHVNKNRHVQLPKNKLIQIDLHESLYRAEDTTHLPLYSKPTDLVYVIYTSGTTGKPKGVMVEHKAFAQFVYNFSDYLFEQLHTTSYNLLSLTNYVFDIFGLEYALPLITGHSITLSSINQVTVEEISANQIIQQTPNSLLPLVTKYAHQLSDKICLVGGEALVSPIAEKLIQSFKKVFNVYGPAETVIWSTAYELTDPSKPHVGKPLFNEQTYVLDTNYAPVPIGVKGELYIGGAGLARGYLNQPDLTSARFILNPFASPSDKTKDYVRLYKTGDMVRWLPDGNLEFIGRYDNQVKVNGYRIELGEIEHALLQTKGIKQACVLTKERKLETGNHKYLVAYYVLDQAFPSFHSSDKELMHQLLRRLPEYMVPHTFLQLESFPLTPNGKLDKGALPEPNFNPLSENYAAPQKEIEAEIGAIWQDLLGLEQIGVTDDFFSIGGNSILSIQLSNRITQAGFSCQVKDIFECKTIAKLAERLEKKSTDTNSAEQDYAIDWKKEIELDPEIIPPPTLLAIDKEPKSILLTGVTGFVGAHLLHDLLENTQANIYCLVRAVNAEEAMVKICQNLNKYQLELTKFIQRIIPIVGTLSEPFFGWSGSKFRQLAKRVDVIYHNGAWVNFVYPYKLLKPSNVGGTVEVLRFACCSKLKPVHHISTFSIFSKAVFTEFGEIDESTPLNLDPLDLDGYSQSKWVAERLIMEAQARGIPANIYRLGHITGHSQIGICHTSDLLWNQIKSCIQLQISPILDTHIDITPVDFVSNAIVHLSKHSASFGQVFHLVSQNLVSWDEVFNHVRTLGYYLEPRNLENWYQELVTRTQNDPQNALYPFLSLFKNELDFIDDTGARFHSTQTHAELSHIVCHPPSLALFERYFAHFINNGFIEPSPKLLTVNPDKIADITY